MDAFDDMMDTPTFHLIGIVFFTSQSDDYTTLQAISTIAKIMFPDEGLFSSSKIYVLHSYVQQVGFWEDLQQLGAV